MKYENAKDILPEALLKEVQEYAGAGLLEEWLTLYYSAFYPDKIPVYEKVICCGVLKVPLRLIEDEKEKNEESAAVERVTRKKEPLMLKYKNGAFFLWIVSMICFMR